MIWIQGKHFNSAIGDNSQKKSLNNLATCGVIFFLIN